MKKYLLFLFAMLCGSIGVWANVTYPFNFGNGSSVDYNTSTSVMTVNIATTGDFQVFVDNLAWSGEGTFNLNKIGNLRIVCTNNAVVSSSEITNLKSAKSNNAFNSLDLTNAKFDNNSTITSLMANGVSYIALPSGMEITDVTLPAIANQAFPVGVVTSDGISATYTAYNGNNSSTEYFCNWIFKGSTLQSISDWTVTNGESYTIGDVTVSGGAVTDAILSGIVANSSSSSLNISLSGIELDNDCVLNPSTSLVNLKISGLHYKYSYEALTISSGSTLTTLTIEDAAIPKGLLISGCSELTTADLRGVRKKGDGTLTVTFTDDPKLSNVTLYKSESDVSYTLYGTTPKSITPTWALPAIPLEYDGCKVTINLAARGTKTMSELITEAQTKLGSTSICTLIVTGELSATDLESLDYASAATRIDLSEATLASGASIDNIQVPTTLQSLVLPPASTVSSTLESTLSNCAAFEYAYSNSSDNGATVPNYVWIAKTGVMSHVFANESSLVSSVYVKVAAKSGVELDATSVDLSATGMTSLAFLDVSESGLTTAAAASYKCPAVNAYTGYRIILPNNWTGDQMAVFAANNNVGAIAAVYSYSDTKLNIMEIVDASYSPAALADPRIMRGTTTEVDVISGFYAGKTFSEFGPNLLSALNNMGKSTFSVTTTVNNEPVTNEYTNAVGTNVKTIVIDTGAKAPNALTFDNPTIERLTIAGVTQANAALNVDACVSLKTLDLNHSTLQSVDASVPVSAAPERTGLTSVDLAATVINGAADFSNSPITTLTTTDETSFNGALNLTNTKLTAFNTAARIVGDVSLNGTTTLSSIDVTGANFVNTTSKIHIDKSATEADGNTEIIDKLEVSGTKTIKVPTGFDAATRIHPYTEAQLYIDITTPVIAAVTYAASDMVFHDKNADNDGDNYRYWYQGASTGNQIATIGLSADRSLAAVIDGSTSPSIDAHSDLKSNAHVKIKIVGTLTAADIARLKDLNCTMLDLSEAVIADGLLKTKIADGDILNANTRFLVLPGGYTREGGDNGIINGTDLAKLKNVYCVIAAETTDEGRNLTSWSRVAGALQPAVVGAFNSSAQSWNKTPDTKTRRNIYTSDVSNFKACKLSGLINSYDLSKANQQLDGNGHLKWNHDAPEGPYTDETRELDGGYFAYGPFSACFQLTEIDLKGAKFEQIPSTDRYYCSDMTLSTLNVISTATYKVVIPTDPTVTEIPANFMNCATYIRAIGIPSNIKAIRTRAFYTIDYCWTTGGANDPEGTNTRLDNGAKLKDGTQVYATIYQDGHYVDNPAFLNSYYTADYSGENGGGTYTIGSNIKLIETGAFANTEPNVKDVYVLNTEAPECHVDAFNTVMYTGNGGYNSTLTDGIIQRSNYYNNRWITMLHYPRQTTTPNIQRYTDPTRQYSIATGERDGKGATLYFPNQSEFIRAYQQGTYGYIWNAWDPTRQYGSVSNGTLTNTTSPWTADGQAIANGLFDAYSSGTNHEYTSFYKVNYNGETITAPKANVVPYYQVNWNETSYTTVTTGNLYPQSEKDLNSDADESGEMTSKDYRGWHQFVLNAYAANTVLDEEPYRSYVADNDWWTICSPFDITRKEAILLFGTEGTDPKLPYVSKLQYVRRTYAEPKIHLNFSRNLMLYKEDRAAATDQHGQNDDKGVVKLLNTPPDDDDVVIAAGVPYMIKPYMTSGGLQGGFNRQFHVYTDDDYEKLTEAQKAVTSPKPVKSTSLHDKIKASQELSGTQQMALIHSGKYSVPVFVNGTNEGYTQEQCSGSYDIGGTTYSKSSAFYYTFVGTFYNSFMPQYVYFLGWNGSRAQFFYNDGAYDGNNMHWANETGIICPTTSAFTAEVTPAKVDSNVGLVPAQWELNGIVNDDSFTAVSGSRGARSFDMTFDSPEVIAVGSDVTGISELPATDASQHQSGGLKVYSVDGQLKGHSLDGLRKGIYVVNGMKYVVK